MKPKIKRKDLINNDDIWNAVISAVSEYNFPTESKIANETFIVFHYYSELESGGHESLFTWFSEYIKEVGITNYLKELIAILEKIDAHDYAAIEKKYGEEMRRLFIALENDEIEENEFYSVIEKANNEYDKLNDKLGDLLETYFVNIHTNLIEIVED
ncbi:hypothetical protein [Metabacillus litoralis]|uniref:DMP19 family protein n=1 Tax=Metabacillus litoralis TaxID=152268 RepID=UPI00203CCEC9|nr:hypothetical protein [Metabacillus litoralis]MCM3655306.1 hypothetical protein [Metabacillus litoralis]